MANPKINGMAIATAIGHIYPNSETFTRVFAVPNTDKPDPKDIFDTELIRWPKEES